MAKKKARRKAKRRMKRRARRAPSAAAVGSLKGVIAGLNQYRKRLLADHAAIDAKVLAIDGALSTMGIAPGVGAGARGRRVVRAGRGIRAGSLKDYIGRVLAGRGVMSVKDVTGRVLKAGYKTKNKTLAKSVGIALTQMKGVAKVRRGQFRMK